MTNLPIKFMYLNSKKFESDSAVRGAFLLTDNETKPLEFRCTNPIRPTQLQKMLYGNILDQYILVELIGIPLVQSSKEQPNFVLVNDISLLDLRTKLNIPVILLSQQENIGISSDESEASFLTLNSKSGKFSPITIKSHNSFSDDLKSVKDIFSQLFELYDLIEPFDRVSIALDQVHSQKIGEV